MVPRYGLVISVLMGSTHLFAMSPGMLPMTSLYKLYNKPALQQVLIEYEKGDTYEGLKRSGIAYHNLAALNVGGASVKAIRYLKKAYERNPSDSITLAYLGSATTMSARDSWNIFTKMEEANRGFNMLDKAVALDPNNAILRVIRINNSLEAPDFLGRKRMIKPDLSKIDQILSDTPGQLDVETLDNLRKKTGKINP